MEMVDKDTGCVKLQELLAPARQDVFQPSGVNGVEVLKWKPARFLSCEKLRIKPEAETGKQKSENSF